jgi:hypothetical protein
MALVGGFSHQDDQKEPRILSATGSTWPSAGPCFAACGTRFVSAPGLPLTGFLSSARPSADARGGWLSLERSRVNICQRKPREGAHPLPCKGGNSARDDDERWLYYGSCHPHFATLSCARRDAAARCGPCKRYLRVQSSIRRPRFSAFSPTV